MLHKMTVWFLKCIDQVQMFYLYGLQKRIIGLTILTQFVFFCMRKSQQLLKYHKMRNN